MAVNICLQLVLNNNTMLISQTIQGVFIFLLTFILINLCIEGVRKVVCSDNDTQCNPFKRLRPFDLILPIHTISLPSHPLSPGGKTCQCGLPVHTADCTGTSFTDCVLHLREQKTKKKLAKDSGLWVFTSSSKIWSPNLRVKFFDRKQVF